MVLYSVQWYTSWQKAPSHKMAFTAMLSPPTSTYHKITSNWQQRQYPPFARENSHTIPSRLTSLPIPRSDRPPVGFSPLGQAFYGRLLYFFLYFRPLWWRSQNKKRVYGENWLQILEICTLRKVVDCRGGEYLRKFKKKNARMKKNVLGGVDIIIKGTGVSFGIDQYPG